MPDGRQVHGKPTAQPAARRQRKPFRKSFGALAEAKLFAPTKNAQCSSFLNLRASSMAKSRRRVAPKGTKRQAARPIASPHLRSPPPLSSPTPLPRLVPLPIAPTTPARYRRHATAPPLLCPDPGPWPRSPPQACTPSLEPAQLWPRSGLRSCARPYHHHCPSYREWDSLPPLLCGRPRADSLQLPRSLSLALLASLLTIIR